MSEQCYCAEIPHFMGISATNPTPGSDWVTDAVTPYLGNPKELAYKI